jgi:hypothetical protein
LHVEILQIIRNLKLAQRGQSIGVCPEHLVCESPLSIGDLRFRCGEFSLGNIEPALSSAAQFQRQRHPYRKISLVRRSRQSPRRVLKIDRGIRPEAGLPEARTPAL